MVSNILPILRVFPSQVVRRGTLAVETAGGVAFTIGDGTGIPLGIRLVDRAAERQLPLNSRLAFSEASVRYLAYELGPKDIRVHAISAGPIKTRAASGIEHFDEILREAAAKAPLRRSVDACEIGRVAVLLATDHGTSIKGEILHADAGFHVAGLGFPSRRYALTRIKDGSHSMWLGVGPPVLKTVNWLGWYLRR